MKKQRLQKQIKTQNKLRTINQFLFIITPQSVQFPPQLLKSNKISNKQSNKQTFSYYIYVQKGAQVLGKINQLIYASRKQYIFQRHHHKHFRVANDKNLTYQWSIYKLTQDQEEQFLQTIQFNIKHSFQQFLTQFYQMQNDLYRIYHQKQKKIELQEIWKDLKHDHTKNKITLNSIFIHLNIKLAFNLYIKSQYDFMYQKWQENKRIKKNQKLSAHVRKQSVDSKYSKNKSSDSSLIELKIKNQDIMEPFTLAKPNNMNNMGKQTNSKNKEKQFNSNQLTPGQDNAVQQNIRESQIRITSPQGVDVTAQIPQKFINHRKANEEDYYCVKKTSMLSDIIQQSYQGSSNLNATKSNQGQRLKSVQTINQQEEPIFSPQIKTQTFQSQKHQQYFNGYKRTSTLAQKASQQFELQQTPKNNSKKSSQYFPNNQSNHSNLSKTCPNQIQLNRQNIMVSQNMKSSRRLSSQMQQREKQTIQSYSQAKAYTIKNIIKTVVILTVIFIALNVFGIFRMDQRKQNQRKKNNKPHKNNIDQPQVTNSKHIKSKSNKSKH